MIFSNLRWFPLLVVGGLALGAVALPGRAQAQTQTGDDWTPYLPNEAFSDAFSEPLKYVGAALGLFDEGALPIKSCVWRNSKVTVVREYCPNTPSHSFLVDAFYLIPNDGRGALYAYKEPTITEVDLFKPADPSPGHLPIDPHATAAGVVKWIKANVSNEGPCCFVGSNPGDRKLSAPACGSGDGTRFTTPWMGALADFWDHYQSDFDHLVATVQGKRWSAAMAPPADNPACRDPATDVFKNPLDSTDLKKHLRGISGKGR